MIGFLSGCALFRPLPELDTPDPKPVDPTPTTTATATTTTPTPVQPHVPEPVTPAPPPRPAPDAHITILVSSGTAAYQGVAIQLAKLLVDDDFRVYDLATDSMAVEAALASLGEKENPLVVAIGLQAATIASEQSDAPVLFCQVFNFESNGLGTGNARGVAAIPPLQVQLDVWTDIDDKLESIGAVFGPGHETLIAEAESAARAAGIELHYRIAESDRETLYLFKRLVPDIDGFWLFPDNRILSGNVLKQILEYAARHRKQIVVFQPAMLKLGAVMSVTSVETDIALTVHELIQSVLSDGIDAVPALTPLTEIDIVLNDPVLMRLGLLVPDDYTHLVNRP